VVVLHTDKIYSCTKRTLVSIDAYCLVFVFLLVSSLYCVLFVDSSCVFLPKTTITINKIFLINFQQYNILKINLDYKRYN